MAEALLYCMGPAESDYLRWAIRHAKPGIAPRIRQVMAAFRRERQPRPPRWPSVGNCLRRLRHRDEVIAIMAAQVLQQRGARGLPQAIRDAIARLLDSAARRPWYVRYPA